MKLLRDTNACVGCGTCGLICSFHHHGIFSREQSSIRVLTDMRTGRVEWVIDSTCDDCRGEEQPLCVKYCAYGALSSWGREAEER